MRHALNSAIFFFLLLLTKMATQEEVQVFRQKEQGSKLVSAGNAFAFSLYKQLSAENEGKNLFFSPASISFALGMTYLGARGNTASEVAEVMKFSLVDPQHLHTSLADLQRYLRPKKEDFVLHTANRLYGHIKYQFVEEFLSATRNHYDAEIEAVDFEGAAEATRVKINKWVEGQTNDKITDLIPEGALNAMTRLVLVNAIYFKGDWISQFDKAKTKDEPFYLNDSDSVTVPMMTQQEKFILGYNRELKTKALELPYKGDRLSMIILLPDTRTGLPDLESSLTPEQLSNIQGTFRGRKVKTIVHLPRFKLEASFDLKDTFQQLGMSEIFDAARADLSGINAKNELFVSKVVHKAFLNVDEEGSEAAAATGVVMMARSMPMIMDFRADHPFLIMIRENTTGAILFLGRMTSPEGSGNSSDKSEL